MHRFHIATAQCMTEYIRSPRNSASHREQILNTRSHAGQTARQGFGFRFCNTAFDAFQVRASRLFTPAELASAPPVPPR
jgi:hypothetical protein